VPKNLAPTPTTTIMLWLLLGWTSGGSIPHFVISLVLPLLTFLFLIEEQKISSLAMISNYFASFKIV